MPGDVDFGSKAAISSEFPASFPACSLGLFTQHPKVLQTVKCHRDLHEVLTESNDALTKEPARDARFCPSTATMAETERYSGPEQPKPPRTPPDLPNLE